jgi:hypothetical protein
VSPAAAAVRWDVLVAAPGHVVRAGDVTPVPCSGQGRDVEVLVGQWACDEGFFAQERGGAVAGVPLFVDDFGGLGDFCGVALVVGPSVAWDCPAASRFNTQIVNSSDQSEISLFSPIASPGIPDNPVLGPILLTPSDHTDIMIQLLPASLINKDTRSVINQVLSDSNGTCDWPTLIDLIHNIQLPIHKPILTHSIDLSSFLSPAASIGQTILTLDLTGASNPVIQPVRLIGRAGLISDVIPVDPFVGGAGVAAVAALIHILAADQHLRGEVDVGPGGLPGDLDTVAQGGGGGEGPAGSAVDWDVLVALVGQVVRAVDVAPPEVSGQLGH